MNYVIHILQIKLWEWEGVKEKLGLEIHKSGPEKTICNSYTFATERIQELKKAIDLLNKQQ